MSNEDTARPQAGTQISTPGSGLNAARRTSIATALQEYQEVVTQHNMAMLRILVDGMATQEDDSILDEEIEDLRLLPFTDEYLGDDLPDSVQVVQDLLGDAVFAELTTGYSLNGLSNRPVDMQKRNRWFSDVRHSIQQKAPSVSNFPADDLVYLCSLVNGITGSGLPYYHSVKQIEFLSDPDPKVRKVLTHNELSAFEPLWRDWDITIACRLGTGLRGFSGGVTLYCRKESASLDWQWRYGIYDEGWCSDVYNTIEEFLTWYAHYHEQTAEEVADDIRPLDPSGL